MRWLVFAGVVVRWCECGWVDPDTPNKARSIKSLHDGVEHRLVFSDEFEVEGRVFDDGSDPRWTAIHKNDYTNAALHFYHKDYVRTTNGVLNITTTSEDTHFTSIQVKNKKFVKDKFKKNYRSGMVQTWNKFCFTGGVVEISARLPGRSDVGGLWPAMWMLGNLARSTYVHSSDFVWPWSWTSCDRSVQRKQRINACQPRPHYGLNAGQGRGSPEIDILEAMPGTGWLPWGMRKPYFSTSFQVAPAKTGKRPQNGNMPGKGEWYEGMRYSKKLNTSLNVFFYGMTLDHGANSYTADAISANTPIGASEFDELHKYRLEWDPRRAGGIRWYLDGRFVYEVPATALAVTGAVMPNEPMYLLLNTALSSTWGFPNNLPADCPADCHDCKDPTCACALAPGFCESLPASFLVDYVRVYQRDDDQAFTVGCSTDTHPSKKWIEGHADEYSDPDSIATQRTPLLDLQRGGAKCRSDADCQGAARAKHHGEATVKRDEKPSTCERRRCVCGHGLTGPTCMAHVAYDDVDYDRSPPMTVAPLYLPPALARAAPLIATAFAALVIVELTRRKAKRT